MKKYLVRINGKDSLYFTEFSVSFPDYSIAVNFAISLYNNSDLDYISVSDCDSPNCVLYDRKKSAEE